MAWNPLPTDYTDAVWEGLKKYNEVNNPDGTVSFQDMTVYSGKEKSFFGAKDANQMNGAVNELMSYKENGQLLCNPNLLHNWYFADPINQRQGYICLKGTMAYGNPECTTQLGLTENPADALKKLSNGNYQMLNVGENLWYVKAEDAVRGYAISGTYQYTIDRWLLLAHQASSITVEDGSITFKGIENDAIFQRVDSERLFEGLTYTLSVLTADGELLTATFALSNQVKVYRYNDLRRCAIGKSPDGKVWEVFAVVNYTGVERTINIKAVKLEFGNTQTLAHKEGDTWVLNDPPTDPQQELAKCQRYFYKLQAADTLGAIRLDSAPAANGTQLFTTVRMPVPMRVSPSMTYSALEDFVAGQSNTASGSAPTKLTKYQMDTGNQLVSVTCTGSYTAGTVYSLFLMKGGWLEFSADL